MTFLKSFLIGTLIVFFSNKVKANDTLHLQNNDSLTLAQAYINLSLTDHYFNTLKAERISKILPFEESELHSIKDSVFNKENSTLLNFSFSLLYFNKARLFFKNKIIVNREWLLQCKKLIDKAIFYFNHSDIDSYFTVEKTKNSYFELIAFDGEACFQLQNQINTLKDVVTRNINANIYPDFKRIYYEAKNSNNYYFDSLSYYSNIFNLPLSMAIKNNETEVEEFENYGPHNLSVKTTYTLATDLDLISKYLQLSYLIKEKQAGDTNHLSLYNLYHSYFDFIEKLNPGDSLHFWKDDGIIQKDSFFKKELNQSSCDSLYALLQKNFPYRYIPIEPENRVGSTGPYNPNNTKYYFPIPAPFPSAYLSYNNFKPGLITMKQVDTYFKKILNKKGYAGHLHYYYVESGYAFTTSLEKINKDGSPVNGSKRWSVSIGGNGSFSLYETFKSIFFATESNFRIIGFIIAPEAATVQSSPTSISTMQDLLTYSYPSLPPDLEDFSLPKKTLTILVYNFYQSDIGKVPMVDVSGRLSVKDHIEKSGLGELLKL